MKSNYQSHSKMDQLSNSREQRIQTLYEGLNFEDWLLTKSLLYEIGLGFGRRYYVLPLLITKLLLFLFPHLKDTTTFTISIMLDRPPKVIINHGVLQVMIIPTSRKRK